MKEVVSDTAKREANVTQAHAANIGSADSAAGLKRLGNVDIEMPRADEAAGAEFRAAMERQMASARDRVSGAAPAGGAKPLGEAMAVRVTDLASEFQKDQQYVSKLLEKASRTGDSMHLMRAMLALHDYQIRIQAMSKTVNKVISSVDQLTKLQ